MKHLQTRFKLLALNRWQAIADDLNGEIEAGRALTKIEAIEQVPRKVAAELLEPFMRAGSIAGVELWLARIDDLVASVELQKPAALKSALSRHMRR